MTATITPHDRVFMTVDTNRNDMLDDAIRAIGACAYDYHRARWLVPIMRLPSMVALMDCAIDEAVTVAYHALLRRMLADFAGSAITVTATKGKLQITGGGKMERDCLQYHAVGVLAVLEGQGAPHAAIQRSTSQSAESWQLALLPPATESTVITHGDRLMHAGIINAKKAADKKAAITKRRRYGI